MLYSGFQTRCGSNLVLKHVSCQICERSKVVFFGRYCQHDPQNTWRSDFTCCFVTDQNLATHATKYSEDYTNTLLCPPSTFAKSRSHYNLTSWTGDLTLHYIHDGEIFAVSRQRYISHFTPRTPQTSHTASSCSNNQNLGTAIAPFLPIPTPPTSPLWTPVHVLLFLIRAPCILVLSVFHFLILEILPVGELVKKCVLWVLLVIPGVWWVDLQVDGVKRGYVAIITSSWFKDFREGTL